MTAAERSGRSGRSILLVALLSFVIAGLVALITMWLPFHPLGSEGVTQVGAVVGAAIALAFFVGGPVLFIAMLFPGLRWMARPGIMLVSVLFLGWMVGAWLGIQQVGRELVDFSERARLLTAAIEDHTASHGSPPASLEELVPTYYEARPTTGFGGHPHYSYALEASGEPRGWTLVVDTSDVLSSGSRLVFDPEARFDDGNGRYAWIGSRYGDWSWRVD